MPKRDVASGEHIISETGNWNVAAEFSKLKIMKPLYKCDFFEDLAKFGYESVMEELMNYNVPNDYIRYKGLRRLINELLRVCNNSKFAMKKGKTKETMVKFEKNLENLKKLLPSTYSIKRNDIKKTQEMKIVEKPFGEILEIVLKIKASINVPLNQNHLIFTDKEEFNPRAFKDRKKERMENKG